MESKAEVLGYRRYRCPKCKRTFHDDAGPDCPSCGPETDCPFSDGWTEEEMRDNFESAQMTTPNLPICGDCGKEWDDQTQSLVCPHKPLHVPHRGIEPSVFLSAWAARHSNQYTVGATGMLFDEAAVRIILADFLPLAFMEKEAGVIDHIESGAVADGCLCDVCESVRAVASAVPCPAHPNKIIGAPVGCDGPFPEKPLSKCKYCREGVKRVQLTDGTMAHEFQWVNELQRAWCEPCTDDDPADDHKQEI